MTRAYHIDFGTILPPPWRGITVWIGRPGPDCTAKAVGLETMDEARAFVARHGAVLMTETRPARRSGLMAQIEAEHEAGRPAVPDAVYDRLAAEEEAAGRPRPVGAPVPPGTARVTLIAPMLSLAKAHDMGALMRWERTVEGLEVETTRKLDGVALALRYEGGRLAWIATRGDGHIGQDVSHARPRICNLPTAPAFLPDRPVEIRGECYVTPAGHGALNRDRGHIETARAAVAAALRASGPCPPVLRFAAWGMADAMGAHHAADLAALGFETVRTAPIDAPVDGTVHAVADPAARLRLGATAKAPRWAIARKF